ncbi:MAG TPA: phospholipase [Thermoanaerobaculia bacterium]|jgi:predicted esterase|nr:phospholipase [Thermoanaerobaculia bacterium]
MAVANETLTLSVPAQVHGTVLYRGPLEEGVGAVPLLVGFHGYGENAERHLAELVRIPGTERWLVAAVQALHPFYTRTQEVVASWMTRFDREHAIEDNIAYVAAVVERLRERIAGSTEGPLVYAGFSQGVAMAYRAAAGGGAGCHGVIALGGDVPPEISDQDLATLPTVLVGAGVGESFYTPSKLNADIVRLRAAGVDARPAPFAGGHEWTDEFRGIAGRFLAELL